MAQGPANQGSATFRGGPYRARTDDMSTRRLREDDVAGVAKVGPVIFRLSRWSVAAWRALEPSKKLGIRQSVAIDRVVASMAMEGEPVSQE